MNRLFSSEEARLTFKMFRKFNSTYVDSAVISALIRLNSIMICAVGILSRRILDLDSKSYGSL